MIKTKVGMAIIDTLYTPGARMVLLMHHTSCNTYIMKFLPFNFELDSPSWHPGYSVVTRNDLVWTINKLRVVLVHVVIMMFHSD